MYASIVLTFIARRYYDYLRPPPVVLPTLFLSPPLISSTPSSRSSSGTSMHPHHTLDSAIGGLPVEIWDYIIDLIAADPSGWASGGYIPRCMLVCKTWVPRCWSHTSPYKCVIICSAKAMESYAILLRTSPRRARSVEYLAIQPEDVTNCRWVTLVPVRLPRLPDLRQLALSNIDFEQQDTRFSQFYSSFRCPKLHIEGRCGGQWPRLTVSNLDYFKITTGLYRDNTWSASTLGGRFKLRSTTRTLEVEAAWSELASLSHRDIHAPSLERLYTSLARSDLTFREDDRRLWTNVVGLFRVRTLPVLTDVSVNLRTTGSFVTVTLTREYDLLRITMEGEEGYAYVIRMLPLLASFRFRKVRFTPKSTRFPTVAEGRGLDEVLTRFRTLVGCSFGSWIDMPLNVSQCALETWHSLLPQCARKGLLERACLWDEVSCDFHHKLKDSENYRTLPQKEKVFVGLPPEMRHDIWAEWSGTTTPPFWVTNAYSRLRDVALVEARNSATIQADAAAFKITHPKVNEAFVSRAVAVYLTITVDVKYSSALLDVAGFMCRRGPPHSVPAEVEYFAAFYWLTRIHLLPYLCDDYSLLEKHAAWIKTSLQSSEPELAKVLFEDLSIRPDILCRAWLPGAFVNVLPDDDVLRVWDILFSDGVTALLRTAMAILVLCKPSLIAATSQSTAMEILLNPPRSLLPPLSENLLKVILSMKLVDDEGIDKDTTRRCAEWDAVLTNAPASGLHHHQSVGKLVQAGIPEAMRDPAWSGLTKAKVKWTEGQYEQTVKVAANNALERNPEAEQFLNHHSQVSLQQLLDLIRPYFPVVAEGTDPPGLVDLARFTLLQSPNNAKEEDIFWTVLSLAVDQHPYLSTTSDTRLEQDAAWLVARLDQLEPDLSHTLFFEWSLSPVALYKLWIPTAFVGTLPADYVRRVWNLFLFHGPAILFRTAVALLLSCKAAFSGIHGPDGAMRFLSRPPESTLPLPDTFFSVVLSVQMDDDNLPPLSSPGLDGENHGGVAPSSVLDDVPRFDIKDTDLESSEER
ncbi:hypothetical protein BXZ70DRAFT_486474 [Cristinia sonorae]|uniref:Rab-GAP TBC domain-containing protein n=1 Tax=Cristinia sonorae TaxID=1940300 RepID=A0A8K0UH11_9AGAR|nr:hypothetical protein BXZ70DRAFT_486474 [Cristinia sonorae]